MSFEACPVVAASSRLKDRLPSRYLGAPEEVTRSVHQVVAVLRQELYHHPHPNLPDLLRRAEVHAEGMGPVPDDLDHPVLCPTLLIDGKRIRTLSTVLRFDKATDVTMAELRVELVFPADAEGEAFFRSMAG